MSKRRKVSDHDRDVTKITKFFWQVSGRFIIVIIVFTVIKRK